MANALRHAGIYLIKTCIFRIWMFIWRWYVRGFLAVYGFWLGVIRATERRLAIRINVRFLFQPLYQERNITGYTFGFLYRLFKIILGGLWYGTTACIAILVYGVWAAIPMVVLYNIIIG